jgi:hypothetical protein
MPAELIESSTYEQDGIIYNIVIVHAEEGYWGKCYCTRCEESDVGTKECETPEEAKQLAKTNADSHHRAIHDPKQSPTR